MPQPQALWEEIPQFCELAKKLIEKYQERFAGLDANWIVAYVCTNKDRPQTQKMLYRISGEPEPECYTNTKKYFVKMYQKDWDSFPTENKMWLVFSILERIDKASPSSGRVSSLDYKDQGTCVRTLGADWVYRDNLPDLLNDKVTFKTGMDGE